MWIRRNYASGRRHIWFLEVTQLGVCWCIEDVWSFCEKGRYCKKLKKFEVSNLTFCAHQPYILCLWIEIEEPTIFAYEFRMERDWKLKLAITNLLFEILISRSSCLMAIFRVQIPHPQLSDISNAITLLSLHINQFESQVLRYVCH